MWGSLNKSKTTVSRLMPRRRSDWIDARNLGRWRRDRGIKPLATDLFEVRSTLFASSSLVTVETVCEVGAEVPTQSGLDR
jgi:hypothetical protein